MEYFKPVDLAHIREAENGCVGTCDKQMLYKVLILNCCRTSPRTTSALRLVIGQRLCLGVALMRNRDNAVFLGDEILNR